MKWVLSIIQRGCNFDGKTYIAAAWQCQGFRQYLHRREAKLRGGGGLYLTFIFSHKWVGQSQPSHSLSSRRGKKVTKFILELDRLVAIAYLLPLFK